MIKKNQGPDIIEKILEACYNHNKDALFTMSLMHQYEARGWLTKKQLQGLHNKASKIKELPTGLLATLEATINKMPNRDKTPIDTINTSAKTNPNVVHWIESILLKYPQHKTVLALKAKLNKEKELSATDSATIEKIFKAMK
jgi:hypothetical protein